MTAPAPVLRLRLGAALALVLATGGCADKPPPPPLLSLGTRACSAAPLLDSATSIAIGDDRSQGYLFSEAAPCFAPAGGAASAYVAYRLPASGEAYILSVTSVPVGQALFSPRMLLLDADGKVVREIVRTEFTFHSASLYAAVRAHPEERYLVVASDPATIGQPVSRISEVTRTTTYGFIVPGGTVAGSYHSGQDSVADFVCALNGTTLVNAQPVPKAP